MRLSGEHQICGDTTWQNIRVELRKNHQAGKLYHERLLSSAWALCLAGSSGREGVPGDCFADLTIVRGELIATSSALALAVVKIEVPHVNRADGCHSERSEESLVLTTLDA